MSVAVALCFLSVSLFAGAVVGSHYGHRRTRPRFPHRPKRFAIARRVAVRLPGKPHTKTIFRIPVPARGCERLARTAVIRSLRAANLSHVEFRILPR